MLSGGLFQAVGPVAQKARSPNLVQDDHFDTANQTSDVASDRNVDRLSVQ